MVVGFTNWERSLPMLNSPQNTGISESGSSMRKRPDWITSPYS